MQLISCLYLRNIHDSNKSLLYNFLNHAFDVSEAEFASMYKKGFSEGEILIMRGSEEEIKFCYEYLSEVQESLAEVDPEYFDLEIG